MKNPIINNSILLITSSIVIVILSTLVFFILGVLVHGLFIDTNTLLDFRFYMSGDYSNPAIVSFTKTLQIFQSIGLFVVPPFIIVFLSRKEVLPSLSILKQPKLLMLILAAAVMLVGMPLIDVMSTFNSQMSLPESLSWLENWMRQSEENAANVTKVFLDVKTTSGLLLNLFMVALIPAIGEELMFRGFIQNFIAKRLNIHIAIFISAFIFSAIHMQFFGFIPRLVMGMFFGYLLYWSGSIWVPMFAHFVNNATAVIITYKMGVEQMSSESFIDDKTNYTYITIASLFITASLIYAIYRYRNYKYNSDY